MKKTIVCFMLLVVAALPVSVFAATIESGQSVTVTESKKDLYLFGSTVNVNSDTAGDVVGFAGNFNVNNKIAESAFVVSGTADIRESIGRHLRVLSGDTSIASTIGGDAVVVGSSLNLAKSSQISGDLIFVGGPANLSGTVRGKTQITSGSARVAGQYAGDFVFNGGTLEIADGTTIAGKLTYYSPEIAEVAPTAKISGGVEYHKTEGEKEGLAALKTRGELIAMIEALVAITVFALILFFVLKPIVKKTIDLATNKPAQSGLYGLAAVIIIPIVSFILCFSIVGAMIGLTSFSIFFAIMFIAYGLSAIYLGSLCFNIFSKNGGETNPVWICLVGSLILVVFGLIPYIGPWIKFIIFLIVTGAFVVTIKNILSSKELWGRQDVKRSK